MIERMVSEPFWRVSPSSSSRPCPASRRPARPIARFLGPGRSTGRSSLSSALLRGSRAAISGSGGKAGREKRQGRFLECFACAATGAADAVAGIAIGLDGALARGGALLVPRWSFSPSCDFLRGSGRWLAGLLRSAWRLPLHAVGELSGEVHQRFPRQEQGDCGDHARRGDGPFADGIDRIFGEVGALFLGALPGVRSKMCPGLAAVCRR